MTLRQSAEPKGKIRSFEDLIVWQKSHRLLIGIYKLTEALPSSEKYNHVSQIQRSAASVPANIAEGFGRYNFQENIQFCRQARGSLEETKNHLLAIRDLNQAPVECCNELISDCDLIEKVLNGYISKTRDLKAGKSNFLIS